MATHAAMIPPETCRLVADRNSGSLFGRDSGKSIFRQHILLASRDDLSGQLPPFVILRLLQIGLEPLDDEGSLSTKSKASCNDFI
jgi:hypothetical protein